MKKNKKHKAKNAIISQTLEVKNNWKEYNKWEEENLINKNKKTDENQ